MDILLKKEKETRHLIDGCLAGKRKAQYMLFKKYYSPMLNVCLRYAGTIEEAKDMLNEGFIKIFANLNMYKEEGSFEAWMKKVMANAAIDFQRKFGDNAHTISYDLVVENEMETISENTALSNLSYNELIKCIQQLPVMSRNVFNLFVFENYSHAEIAELLNMKEGTSHWHLNFARNKLKQEIFRMNHIVGTDRN